MQRDRLRTPPFVAVTVAARSGGAVDVRRSARPAEYFDGAGTYRRAASPVPLYRPRRRPRFPPAIPPVDIEVAEFEPTGCEWSPTGGSGGVSSSAHLAYRLQASEASDVSDRFHAELKEERAR